MLGPVTCAACGAKVRQDRVRCLRCGAALVPKSAARLAALSDRGLTVAAIAACVVIGGMAVTLIGRPAAKVAAANVAPQVPRAKTPAPAAVAAAPTEIAAGPVTGTAIDRVRDGVFAYGRGDIAGSVEQFQAAVDAAPDNAIAQNNLGQGLVRANRAGDAVPHFDRAIALSPEVWAYHFNRGRAFAMLELWPRAIADYQDAAGLFPEDYVTQFNLARAQQANGDLEAAIGSYRKAIGLAPGQPEFQLSLANALEVAGRPAEAAAAYRRFLELQPDAAQADKIKERLAQLPQAAS